jgi:large repetitive protein
MDMERLLDRSRTLALAAVAICLLVPTTALAAGPKPLKIKPPALKQATATLPYSATLSASGGTAPYSFSLHTGSLPEGLGLSPEGVIAGTPPTAGSSTFTVEATDSSVPAQTATATYTLPVQLGVGPKSFHSTRAFGSVFDLLSAAGGPGPFAYSVVAGELPEGISFFSEGGSTWLEGIPFRDGTSEFSIQAQDETTGLTGVRAYRFKVALAIEPPSGSLPKGSVGKSYLAGFSGEGASDLSYSIIEGELPEGLELVQEENTATIKGTPGKAETRKFTAQATDNETGMTAKAKYTIVIAPFAFPKGADRLEETNESGELSSHSLFFEASKEHAGVTTGVIFTEEGVTGTWRYTFASGHLVFTWPQSEGTGGSTYDGSCDLVAEECSGTDGHGTFVLQPF